MVDFALFEGLSVPQRDDLDALLETKTIRSGDAVVREGERGDSLYLVVRGTFEIRKGGVALAEVGPGSDFGSLALLGNEPRSASVVAREPGVLRCLSGERFRHLATERADTYVVLLKNLLAAQNASLRRTTDTAVASLRGQLEEATKRLKMGSFLASIIVLMSVYGFFLRGMIEAVSGAGDSTPVTVGIVVVFVSILYAMMRQSGYPLSVYGLTLVRWRPQLIEALGWTVAFLAFLTGVKWFAIRFVPGWGELPLFALDGFRTFPLAQSLGMAALYAVFAPSQEFVARGAMQSSFQEFLGGRYVTERAIALSTLLFSLSHLHIATSFALLSIIPSVFWGCLYARQRSLLGVSVSHVLVGLWVVFVLGGPGLGVTP